MTKAELMRRVQALAFAKTETELYLDCHPDNQAAIEYYRKLMAELCAAKLEYEDKYGPITADGGSLHEWSWIKGPWPWSINFETEED